MITINDALKKQNGEKEIEIDAPYGINITIDGTVFNISKGDHGIVVRKMAKPGSNDIVVEQQYSNKIEIR
jgi:hypothetical protein